MDLWTRHHARLRCLSTQGKENYNWLFLPGGPGLGSESLQPLIDILNLPGSIWLLDLPGDGSNITENDAEYFSHWQEALIEVSSALPNVILVAHSSGGMFALATPQIEKNLIGLVLMDSAPDASWQQSFLDYVNKNPSAEILKYQKMFADNPSNETLKIFTIACAPYFALPTSVIKMKKLLESLPFNYASFKWAKENFDDAYQAKWIPQKIPTLIFAGEQDILTPLSLFEKNAKFKRKNIQIKTIKEASHFPWLEKPAAVKNLFLDYITGLKNDK